MKITRIGSNTVYINGVADKVAMGDTIDVPKELADSLLRQGYQSDGKAVDPQWEPVKATKSRGKSADTPEEG